MAENQFFHGMFLPKKFFVTKGKAISSVSTLNAFDAALMAAKIENCNLVPVSSILPPDAQQVKNMKITPGTITFCVLARMDGESGETIGAGLAWGLVKGNDGTQFGIIAEEHSFNGEKYIQESLKEKLNEMAKIRNLELSEVNTAVEWMKVPKKKFGSVIVAIIYVPWEQEESLDRVYLY